jgi:hypothetical protein
MEIILIDGFGPFFRGYTKQRINWSKIPFVDLANADAERWTQIKTDLQQFVRQITAQGYNAVTLDDVAHLAPHLLHLPEVATQI